MEAEMMEVPNRRVEDTGVKSERDYILTTADEQLRTNNTFVVK